jgi:flagellar hook-length control protein FliK
MTANVQTNLFQLITSTNQSDTKNAASFSENSLKINDKANSGGNTIFSNILNDLANGVAENKVNNPELHYDPLMQTPLSQIDKNLDAATEGKNLPLIDIDIENIELNEALNAEKRSNLALQQNKHLNLNNDIALELDLDLDSGLSQLNSNFDKNQLSHIKQVLEQDVTLVIHNNKENFALSEEPKGGAANIVGELESNKLNISGDDSLTVRNVEMGELSKSGTNLAKMKLSAGEEIANTLSSNQGGALKAHPLHTNIELNAVNPKLINKDTRLEIAVNKVNATNSIGEKSSISGGEITPFDKLSLNNFALEKKANNSEFFANHAENKKNLDSLDNSNNKNLKLGLLNTNVVSDNIQTVLSAAPKVELPVYQSNVQVDASLLSMAGPEAALKGTPEIQKADLNSVFTQGLNLKQNFTPNLAMRIQWMFNQAISSAEIMMDPPDMGPLTVKIQQHNGETNIMFQVAQSGTKELVEENLAKLKELLEQQGIDLGEASVEQQKQQPKESDANSTNSINTSTEQLEDTHNENNESVVLQTNNLVDIYS